MKDVDVVYHCAATAHEGLSVFSPYEITKNNYLASVSIFSAAVNEKVKRIIFCSSMARYGDQKTPFTEDMKPKPVDPYAISKVGTDLVGRFYAEAYGMTVMTTRMFTHTDLVVVMYLLNQRLQNK